MLITMKTIFWDTRANQSRYARAFSKMAFTEVCEKLHQYARSSLQMDKPDEFSVDVVMTGPGVAWSNEGTVEPLYNTIVFHQNTHKRHPIARP